MTLAEAAELLGAALAGGLGTHFGLRGISRKPDKERIIEMLEEIQEAQEQDISAAREHRSNQAQQIERIRDGLDRSHELTRQAFFELLEWCRREPPTG